MQEVLYKVGKNLYVNLTNKCPCDCTFCLRRSFDTVGESKSLWLEHDADYDEIMKAFENYPPESYEELVFCGFGEPTENLDVLLEVAKTVRKRWDKRMRINTNGMGNLVNKKNIPPLFEGLINTVSISLNNPDPEKFQEMVRCKYKDRPFEEMIEFARECVKYVDKVIMTTVDTTLSREEEEKCAGICKNIGATYRIRAWES